MANDIQHEAQSFFDPNGRPAGDLISLQVDQTTPTPTGLTAASGMALTNIAIRKRLAHFPDDLYDLRDSSHLFRFCSALLGDAGAGQLRRRYLTVQFQATMQGSHFYDLDRFYGAIFGATRTVEELLGIDPTSTDTATATANEWDTMADADAAFRDRIFDLAAAINLGATYEGVKAATEALVRTEVDVYEVWELLDTYGPGGPGRTWGDVEALGTWDDVEAIGDWDVVQATVIIGRTGTNSRAEVVVVPKKNYDQIVAEDGPEEAARQRLEDEHSIIRVLNKTKPASVLLTVDTEGVALHREAQIASLTADSNFWYVASQTVPNPTLFLPNGTAYPLSVQQAIEGILSSDKHEIPKPPWSIQQAARWSYAPSVVSVNAYSILDNGVIQDHSENINTAPDYDTVTYHDGSREKFTPDRGILDPRRALAARYASEGILISGVYSVTRQTVPDIAEPVLT